MLHDAFSEAPPQGWRTCRPKRAMGGAPDRSRARRAWKGSKGYRKLQRAEGVARRPHGRRTVATCTSARAVPPSVRQAPTAVGRRLRAWKPRLGDRRGVLPAERRAPASPCIRRRRASMQRPVGERMPV
ncbi:hypothetical protein TRAPUB_13812 [Trametes pubescens]|uniref:Uncharacterized protein n=1 Tax=Trametes pubescens TaxID=154538 RepID=A0A1M2VQ30_TRAPU|nr:hypothetical protein TRAPUB_13812 [Trametes pubescens]